MDTHSARLASFVFILATVVAFLAATLMWELLASPVAAIACLLLGCISLFMLLGTNMRGEQT